MTAGCCINPLTMSAPAHVPPPQDPFAEKTVYNDGPIDKLFIKLFTQKMADQLEGKEDHPAAACAAAASATDAHV